MNVAGAMVDFVDRNGVGHGPIGTVLNSVAQRDPYDRTGNTRRFEDGLLRPFLAPEVIVRNGRKHYTGRHVPTVNIMTGRIKERDGKGGKRLYYPERMDISLRDLWDRHQVESPVGNATSLRKGDWIAQQEEAVKASRYEMNFAADLRRNRTISVNGMTKTVHQYSVVSEAAEAVVDMDGTSDGRNDTVLYKFRQTPLPITHSDYMFTERVDGVSSGFGERLSTTMAEQAGHVVGVSIERQAIGTEAGITFGTIAGTNQWTPDGTSTLYGALTLPSRITKTNMTVPTGSNPEATVDDFLSILETLRTYKFRGPFMFYTSTDWDRRLDGDYARLGGSNANMTLRDRLNRIDGVAGIKRLDYLFGVGSPYGTNNPWTILVVPMDGRTARMIVGMELTVVGWPSQGGLRRNTKVMTIQAPEFAYDYYGVAPILQATTS